MGRKKTRPPELENSQCPRVEENISAIRLVVSAEEKKEPAEVCFEVGSPKNCARELVWTIGTTPWRRVNGVKLIQRTQRGLVGHKN